MYYYNSNLNIYKFCSELTKDCYKCNNEGTCFECQDDLVLADDDICINKKIIEEKTDNYFYNDVDKKYISCSIIDNC